MDTTKSSKNKEKKIAIVTEVKEKVDKAKAMVFTNYQGLTHKQLETFKREVKKADAEFVATKNTLLKLALGKERVDGQEDKFQQPTGALYVYGDIVKPLKALAQLIKETEKPKIKFGLLENVVITDKDVLKLASLPSREILLAQLARMLNTPIQGFHRALNWNLQKFVMTLSAIAKSKE
ncbi:MAG TPA: 50S ribosomal protein L10 [Patescibacteria group bacterium]|nr:50S ribosomal protein L10 [Patescibacteria group bacterium]